MEQLARSERRTLNLTFLVFRRLLASTLCALFLDLQRRHEAEQKQSNCL